MRNLAATIIKGSIFGATAFIMCAALTERHDKKALTNVYNIAYDSVDLLAILNHKGATPNA